MPYYIRTYSTGYFRRISFWTVLSFTNLITFFFITPSSHSLPGGTSSLISDSPKEIIDQVDDVKNQIHEMINDNTNPNETILIIGVGNTLGVSQ